MIGQCGLDPGLNKCQYFMKEKSGCCAESQGCCFLGSLVKKKEITETKVPKWFEQYYNR